jgi:hypothetical protein
MVNEERTAQVPRVVEKRTPYTYTVRSPRTVVLRVPLDPCGNPIPTAPAAVSAAAPRSAASSSGVVPATAITPLPSAKPAAPAPAASTPTATAAPALTPAEAAPLKTFRDVAPAETAKPAAEGWGPSPLKHADPAVGSPASSGAPTVAERPVAPGEVAAPPLQKIEVIPLPSAKAPATTAPTEAVNGVPAEGPTLEFGTPKAPPAAPSGPSVSPAPPATDNRDVPTAGTSNRPSRYVAPFGDRST